jgi:hypothetical protein
MKKKVHTCLGRTEIPKSHVLCQNTAVFAISSKLQEIMCLLAQSHVFEEAEEILTELLAIKISAKQIQRLSEHYGAVLEEQMQKQAAEEMSAPVLKLKDSREAVYIMVDNSMLFSREEGWKEIKVGRLFNASSRVAVQEKRTEVMQSLYVCHFGDSKDFIQKWEPYTQPYRHKIIIADGAKWIWNWAEDYHTRAVQILDYYHAVEKLGAYASLQYGDEQQRRGWMEQQKKLLVEGAVQKVINHLKQSQGNNKEAQKARLEVVRYYENNSSRMQYKSYLEKGYLIGSGAIESAHRHVVQQRLKLSGQRWSIAGAQQIVNLRACRKSNQWHTLTELIKKAA